MQTLADEGVDGSSLAAGSGRSSRLPSWIVPLSVAAVVAVGVGLRFVQRSPLWLDEALSVNIAELPVGDMLDALKHDGHPPLYYLLLHYWMEVVGDGDVAVRALSGLFAVAALPLMYLAGRRVAGPVAGRWALVVAAASPYMVRYATETRMYSLVMLLVLAGYLLLLDALERPRWSRLVGLALISGLLMLTHYWAFFLVAAVCLLLAVSAWRRPGERGPSLRALVAVALGGVLFLPWLGSFLYQSANTGTPWADPMRPSAIVQTILADLGGGGVLEASLSGAAVVVLVALALFASRSQGHEVTLDLRTTPTVRREMAVVALVVAIGSLVGLATSGTFQGRYAAVIVPLLLLAVAVGIVQVTGVARLVVGLVYLGLSGFGVVWVNYYQRTQSADVAAAVSARAQPGDVVVYCPDQLGPDYSREMPDGLEHLTYPMLESPERVDWVDYAERNEAADPAAIAQEIRERAGGHAIFLVWMSEYKTFGQQCETLISELGLTEGLVVQDNVRFYEPASLHWVPASSATPPPAGDAPEG
jgi:hypothetical protein